MKRTVFAFMALAFLGAGVALAATPEWADLNLKVIGLYQEEKYEEAVPLAQKARDAAESEYGTQSREYVLALNNLAMLYKKTGHTSAAGPLYKQALAVSEKLLGADHPDLALPLNNLAMFYNMQKDYKKADDYSQRAIALLEKAYGSAHSYTAEARDRYEAMKKERV